MSDEKILIVDDDARNIFALAATLKSNGYKSQSAIDVENALNILKENKTIRIILLDMMMPGIDGYEALSILRKNESTKKLIVFAVTAQAMPGDKEKCLRAGADEYISKPINVDVLLELINKYSVS